MTDPKGHIIVVDDDDRILQLLGRFLRAEGYHVFLCTNGAELESLLTLWVPDLVIMDVMMPGEDGISFTKRKRLEKVHWPILLLTARSDVEDRIDGLAAGADDYLPKPFEPRELVLRIQRILARSQQQRERNNMIYFGSFRYDPRQGTLYQNDQLVSLNQGEACFLSILLREPGKVVSREFLATSHPAGPIHERSVDVQMIRLRQKIEPDPKQPRYIQTIRGEGYVFYV